MRSKLGLVVCCAVLLIAAHAHGEEVLHCTEMVNPDLEKAERFIVKIISESKRIISMDDIELELYCPEFGVMSDGRRCISESGEYNLYVFTDHNTYIRTLFAETSTRQVYITITHGTCAKP